MPELELALVELGRSIEFPPTPDITSRVRERIAAERPSSQLPAGAPHARDRARRGCRRDRRPHGGAGNERRHPRVLRRARRRDRTRRDAADRPEDVDLSLGRPVTLEQARELAAFDVLLPETLGEPDEVWFSDSPPGGMVSFVYGSSEEPRALLTQFKATVRGHVPEEGRGGHQRRACRRGRASPGALPLRRAARLRLRRRRRAVPGGDDAPRRQRPPLGASVR